MKQGAKEMNNHPNQEPKKKSEQGAWTRFCEQVRSNRTTRALCVVLLLLLVATTVAVTVTVAANRAKKPPKIHETESTQQGTTPGGAESEQNGAESESDRRETETNPPSPVMDELPSFALPVSGVLSAAHNAELQVYSTTMKDYRVHIGIDVATEAGAPVYAAADGSVEKIWEDPLMGTCMAVRHAGDCMTVYKNLAVEIPAGIEEGEAVHGGQRIATVGDTAMIEAAEEPHLHFEMTVAGLAVDPLAYFDQASLASLNLDEAYE
jgi:murein DD-endopeptidase MepM/ murein hydrolase activator NlpD